MTLFWSSSCEAPKDAKTREFARPNVSSCKFVVTLHGCAREPEERYAIEEAVRRVPGVRAVMNKIGVVRVL
jgi:osmotically-inducible protein OsmY